MPSAGWPSATALATRSSRRAAPSSIENSVWTWRCVNESPTWALPPLRSNGWIANLHHCDSHPTQTSQHPSSQVGARTIGHVDGAWRTLCARHTRHRARRQLPHLFELLAGGYLLGEERRLDAMEQALEPADQLSLGNTQFRVGGHLAVLERQGQVAQLV